MFTFSNLIWLAKIAELNSIMPPFPYPITEVPSYEQLEGYLRKQSATLGLPLYASQQDVLKKFHASIKLRKLNAGGKPVTLYDYVNVRLVVLLLAACAADYVSFMNLRRIDVGKAAKTLYKALNKLAPESVLKGTIEGLLKATNAEKLRFALERAYTPVTNDFLFQSELSKIEPLFTPSVVDRATFSVVPAGMSSGITTPDDYEEDVLIIDTAPTDREPKPQENETQPKVPAEEPRDGDQDVQPVRPSNTTPVATDKSSAGEGAPPATPVGPELPAIVPTESTAQRTADINILGVTLVAGGAIIVLLWALGFWQFLARSAYRAGILPALMKKIATCPSLLHAYNKKMRIYTPQGEAPLSPKALYDHCCLSGMLKDESGNVYTAADWDCRKVFHLELKEATGHWYCRSWDGVTANPTYLFYSPSLDTRIALKTATKRGMYKDYDDD